MVEKQPLQKYFCLPSIPCPRIHHPVDEDTGKNIAQYDYKDSKDHIKIAPGPLK